MAPLASVEELSTRLGVTLSGADLGRAQATLEDASALIRTEAGVALDEDAVPDAIRTVCLEAAGRAFRHPEGETQASVGDVSISFSREGGANAVYLTKREAQVIHRALGVSIYGTITLTTPYAAETSNYYVAVEQGGDPIPLGPFPWEEW